MTDIARGMFEVTMVPQPADRDAADPALGRLWLDKQFHGDLEGTGWGQMLTAMTVVKGSAGYVALEGADLVHYGAAGDCSLS